MATADSHAALIEQAWVVRKCFDMTEETPHFAILVTWHGSVASESAGWKRLTEVLDLPGSFTVFTDTHDKQQARRVRQWCPQPVYRRGRS
ncbi:MAG: hypothetical protein ABIO38_08980 [Luteimonas sp.]